MLSILGHRRYARLFSAQVIALVGTGLLTVALGLLAFDIAGSRAASVLATALSIKIIAYVALSPVITALLADRNPTVVLVAADGIRALMACALPFVHEPWQIYVVIFVLQAASATFTPTFQALIPEILSDEEDYTHALSLSRLAYDLESVLSPLLAAALLTVMSYHLLFIGTIFGFCASAVLVLSARIDAYRRHHNAPQDESFLHRTLSGARIFRCSAELRAVAWSNLAVASAMAMVIITSVVVVREHYHRPEGDLGVLLAFFGAGSMVVAVVLPRLLHYASDLAVITTGCIAAVLLLSLSALALNHVRPWWLICLLWFALGSSCALIATPSSRILRRHSDSTTRTAVFATQFSASHACYLLTYPAAGLVGSHAGIPAAAWTLVVLATAGAAGTGRWLLRAHHLTATSSSPSVSTSGV
ncbi:Multidrug resistance protein MdtG [Corynebacterium ciconiae DSM 44920]|uniref:MFS transporter n=1 Tax=Corynebacterium ciconiae TaxID=227319 RepID=UPI0003701FA4|nr:MFS transporter [Corynebacterium ciconiae]WKD60836.1 Multidrug resistance protein MdtG [Corynebacterium ciconiae DSM 44920]